MPLEQICHPAARPPGSLERRAVVGIGNGEAAADLRLERFTQQVRNRLAFAAEAACDLIALYCQLCGEARPNGLVEFDVADMPAGLPRQRPGSKNGLLHVLAGLRPDRRSHQPQPRCLASRVPHAVE